MKVLRWVGMILLGLVALAGATAIVARYLDGPLGPFPGGPLTVGERVAEPAPDWSFARDLGTIEMQSLTPARSRTVWVLVVDGALFVPCGYPRSKSWPDHVAADPRVVLRMSGRLYERSAVRETGAEILPKLGAEMSRKYGYDANDPDNQGNIWYFRMDPRPAA